MWQFIQWVGKPMRERQQRIAADRAARAAATQQNERTAAFRRLLNRAPRR